MIRDVMVWLDGGVGDEIRLTAVEDLARRLESEAVIGLYLNPLPLPGAIDGDISADLLDGRERSAIRRRLPWQNGSACSIVRLRSGASMCWLTISPM
jgi:hypothetical protein